jgi:hypothetical protein
MARLSIAVILLCGLTGCASIDPIPSTLNMDGFSAKVTGIRFFEKGPGEALPLRQRAYSTRFDEFASRYIAVELQFVYPAPGRAIDVPLSCIYFNPDGTRMGKLSWTHSVQPTWSRSYASKGWGSATPGRWRSGTYQVQCSAEGQISARISAAVERL